MNRRQFTRNLPALGYALVSLLQTPFRALAAWWQGGEEKKPQTLTLRNAKTGAETRIPVIYRFGTGFIGVFQFAQALGFHTYFNSEKHKVVIYLPGSRVLVTENNPFVGIEGQLYQLPYATFGKDNDIFVPYRSFLALINHHTNFRITLSTNEESVQVSERNFNVTHISIEGRKNGTMIRIRTTLTFQPGELVANERNGWFHVDLYRGKGNPEILEKTPPAGIVRRVKIFQKASLLSIMFLLREKPLRHEIRQDPVTHEVVLILWTSESTSIETENGSTPQKKLADERKQWLIDTIVVDAGHGGKDPGAIGYRGLLEKDVNLAIALRLGKLIEKRLPDVKVVYTRTKDYFVPLEKRAEIANKNNGKIFISIHTNALKRNRRSSGFEVYFLGPHVSNKNLHVVERENAVLKYEEPSVRKKYEKLRTIIASILQTAFMRQSEQLANDVHQKMAITLKSIGMKGRGVKQAGFVVLFGVSMPSILIETGFITTPQDARILRTRQYQQKIAEGIFAGIVEYKKNYESSI